MILGTLARTAIEATRAIVSTAFSWADGYLPSPKQQQLHDATARYVLYGGAAGGGKSRAMREDARRFCLSHDRVTVLFLRRTSVELRDTHLLELQREWPAGTYNLNRSEKRVTFPNGSVIIFGHCQYEDDVFRYLSTEYDKIYFDELTTFLEPMYEMIGSRCRSTKVQHPQIIAGTNPGGVGHNWVKDRWVLRQRTQPVMDWRPFTDEEIDEMRADGATDEEIAEGFTWPTGEEKTLPVGPEYQFIQAKLTDHPSREFRRQYRASLLALPPARRRAYLDGDWDVFEGQFFKGWRADEHVITGFKPPEAWPRCLCVDYGSAAPFAAIWIARDPGADRLFVYREYYQAGKLLATNAAEVAALCGPEKYALRVADPSMAESTHDGTTLFDIARKHGLNLQPANNRRMAGWQLLQELLEPAPLPCPYTGRHVRLLVDAGCTSLIRTLPALVHDKKNVEDLDTTGEDHAADALRYGCMALFPQGIGGRGAAGGSVTEVARRGQYGRAA